MSPRRASFLSVIASGIWWRQQLWTVLLEAHMGFVAAVALMQGASFVWVALGLGCIYAISGCLTPLLVYGTRRQAWGWGSVVWIALALTLLLPLTGRWICLILASGILVGMRDAYVVHGIAWMPVRALRAGGRALDASQWALLVGAVHFMFWMIVTGWAATQWTWWPTLLVASISCIGVPLFVWHLPTRTRCRTRFTRFSRSVTTRFTFFHTLTFVLSALSFLGRRLLLPALFVAAALKYDFTATALPLLGGALGIFSVLGMVARMRPHADEGAPHRLLVQGFMGVAGGWLCVALGMIALTLTSDLWPWWIIGAGWIGMEMATRVWGVGFIEVFRHTAIEGRFAHGSAYRSALTAFMSYKSLGAATGLWLAAVAWLAGATAPPFVLAFLTLGALGIWYMGHSHLKGASPSSLNPSSSDLAEELSHH